MFSLGIRVQGVRVDAEDFRRAGGTSDFAAGRGEDALDASDGDFGESA